MNPPALEIPRLQGDTAEDPLGNALTWGALLPPFRTMGGDLARWSTGTRVAWDGDHLHVEFRCEDHDAWGTWLERDAPLWQEEVVEIFLAAGESDPQLYYEIEVSPLCALFDARVTNPLGTRQEMVVDTGWNCAGLVWSVASLHHRQDWRARLAIPWSGLGLRVAPRALRANFFRIERPRGGEDEFSGWSPTLTSPPDFHRPARFGLLRLIE